MEIDELPSGTQDQKPDIDMNEIVGTHDILMLCFDTLRYDVSVAEEASGGTPVLNSYFRRILAVPRRAAYVA